MIGTLNLLFSMRDHVPDCHLVKLGTMGEYGTPNIDIEEGFIEIEHKGRKDTLPFPKLPGSLYHCSKVHDSTQHPLRLPHLGPARDRPQPGRRLRDRDRRDGRATSASITRFDYDEIFGTVLNRFCVQAVIGHPLTVYGSGRPDARLPQHPRHPPVRRAGGRQPGRRAASSASSTSSPSSSRSPSWPSWSSAAAGELGYEVEIEHLENPRVEVEEHYYNAGPTRSCSTSASSRTTSARSWSASMLQTIERHKDRVIERAIDPRTRWKPGELEGRRAAQPRPKA